MNNSKKVEKARKELSDVCSIAGWDLKEQDNFQKNIQIKNILRAYKNLLDIEYNPLILYEKTDSLIYLDKERNAREFFKDSIAKNSNYFRRLDPLGTNPLRGFISAVEEYRNSIIEGNYSDLEGIKGEKANITWINRIIKEIKDEVPSPF